MAAINYNTMVTPEELEQNNILPWNLIENKHKKPDLLLGNGFSIQFSNKFTYSSLFQIFLGNCDPVHQNLFSQFGKTNFELIQKYLSYARVVNSILGLSILEIDLAIEQLKNGLIQTIEEVHPRVHEIDFDQLNNVALQLINFGDIYTTNYELYLYHIIMKSKDLSDKKTKGYVAYQDYFWGTEAPAGFKQFMGYQEFDYKNIFYLHGSLFIFKDGVTDLKLLRDNEGSELIGKISDQIRNNKFPIFVTEGFSADKLNSINENTYLHFCLSRLKKSANAIVIFGNALGEFDSHILNALKTTSKPIVYCIYTGTRTIAQINVEKFDFLSKFNNYPRDIDFVDSKTVFRF